MTIYRYGCINRPPMYGTAPGGFRSGADHPDFAYGTIWYEQPLSAAEVHRYELALLEPLPALPLYPEGVRVKEFSTGKKRWIETMNGEYFAGYRLLEIEAGNWLAVKHWMNYELDVTIAHWSGAWTRDQQEALALIIYAGDPNCYAKDYAPFEFEQREFERRYLARRVTWTQGSVGASTFDGLLKLFKEMMAHED